MSKKLLVCDCLGSQSIDRDALDGLNGVTCSRVHSALCTTQAEFAVAAMQDGDVMIACQQERQRFEELAEASEMPLPDFVDIRDRAGWTADDANTAPKMAALVAESLLPVPITKSMDVVSEGLCLIIGRSDVAISAANQLSDALSVTVLALDTPEPEPERGYELLHGRLRNLRGALGGFDVTIDGLRTVVPGGRGALTMSEPRDGGVSTCDIVVDLSGGQPLVAAPDKREGYLRANPGDGLAVAALLVEAVQLTGTFEKPLFVRLEPSICAHSRAEKIACTNCLDICPTGAITSAGEHVAIDPMICAGCGACSAVCPSGAISYDDPPVGSLFARLETLARAFRTAGGATPRLLVTDRGHGRDMVSYAARYGGGLPADCIPLELDTIAGFGHAEMLAALGVGFGSVSVLLSPSTERDALDRELVLAQAIAGDVVLELLDIGDPIALSDHLFAMASGLSPVEPILPLGNRRQVARLAAKALNPAPEKPIPLPETAPYGAVLVNQDACTLCLACVSLCPSGALLDNEDKPQLRFQEDACLQCGLCATVCPEQAITLQRQLDLSDAALSQRVLNEEDPFECVECGAPFGVKSTVERIVEKLAGKHSMFSNPEAARMIQMCDNCRIVAQYHSENNPFAQGERPKTRTSDDYFSDRRDH